MRDKTEDRRVRIEGDSDTDRQTEDRQKYTGEEEKMTSNNFLRKD